MTSTVLITGASGALGRSVVARFLAAGDRVVAVDRDAPSLDRLASDMATDELVCRQADLDRSADVAEVFDGVEWGEEKGGAAGVVHLVGGFRFASLAECSDEDWEYLVAVNLDTTFRVLRQCCRTFVATGGGSVVAVASPVARLAVAGMGPYGAVKSGVLRLVEAAAREMQPFGGRANAVVPGTMDTPANRESMPDDDPAGWVGTERVADVIHYLSGSQAAAVSGAAVEVPGPTLA